jgi:hypothetical protein
MPIHPFFDVPTYPFVRADAQALYTALYQGITQPGAITLEYQQSGGTRPLTPQLPADQAWGEVLRHLTAEHSLARLCERIINTRQGALQAAAIAVRDAKDILSEILLPQDIVFLDRKPLRNELEKLSRRGQCGVLLVRGASGAGKSWTQQFINLVAEHRGANCVYLYSGTISNVSEVVENLFTALGAGSAVPEPMETEAAWYKRVCNRLQELAQNRKPLWVVADDLGEYPDGPRVDRQIRDFFGQFVLNMANPVFADRFRLVLIDYPEGPVPTKWKSFLWCEDRPQESDVDKATIAEFLLNWAAAQGKQLGAERADELAADILAKADAPPSANNVGRPRLERIYNELQGVLNKL